MHMHIHGHTGIPLSELLKFQCALPNITLYLSPPFFVCSEKAHASEKVKASPRGIGNPFPSSISTFVILGT